MDAAVATEPAGKSWRRLVIGLVLFTILPGAFQFAFPVVETPLLLVPIIAVCAIVGWLAGGKPVLALVWVALAIWFLAVPPGTSSPYDRMARGWALILAGSFGLVSLWNSSTPFLVRALGAVGLAIGTGFLLAISSPGGVDRFERVAASEFTRRSKDAVAAVEAQSQTKRNRELAARSPAFAASLERLEARLRATPRLSAILLPALIALESLAGLALGWAVYQRLSSEKIGPPLSPLREFRFNDQLIWGVAVGATMLLLPPFEEGKNAGLNLLLFFGALYFLRGMGVLSWTVAGRRLLITSLTVVVIFFFLDPGMATVLPPVAKTILGTVLAIGLGDTWLDWRSKVATR